MSWKECLHFNTCLNVKDGAYNPVFPTQFSPNRLTYALSLENSVQEHSLRKWKTFQRWWLEDNSQVQSSGAWEGRAWLLLTLSQLSLHGPLVPKTPTVASEKHEAARLTAGGGWQIRKLGFSLIGHFVTFVGCKSIPICFIVLKALPFIVG